MRSESAISVGLYVATELALASGSERKGECSERIGYATLATKFTCWELLLP